MKSRALLGAGDTIMNLDSMLQTSIKNISQMSTDKSQTTETSTAAFPSYLPSKKNSYFFSTSERYNNSPTKIRLNHALTTSNNTKNKINYLKDSSQTFCTQKLSFMKYSADITDADYIVKDRARNNGYTNLMRRSIMKNKDEICLDNYLIKELIKQRKYIDSKEKNIKKNLENCEKILDKDYKLFSDYIAENNSIDKKQQEILIQKKTENDKISKICMNLLNINKKYIEQNQLEIKKILLVKDSGSFVHKVFGIDFIYNKLPKVCNKQNYSSFTNILFKIYDQDIAGNITTNLYQRILKNEDLLMEKYNVYESNITKIMEERDRLVREINEFNIEKDNILSGLKKHIKELEKSYEDQNEQKNNIIQQMKKIKNIKNIEGYFVFIEELGEMIDTPYPNMRIGTGVDYYVNYCKDIKKALIQKEEEINDYMLEIEKYINLGDEDKELIQNICYDLKKKIRKAKQEEIKKYQDELKRKENERALERSRRIVIKGRGKNLEIHFPKITKTKKIEKTVEANNDEDLLYYSDED